MLSTILFSFIEPELAPNYGYKCELAKDHGKIGMPPSFFYCGQLVLFSLVCYISLNVT